MKKIRKPQQKLHLGLIKISLLSKDMHAIKGGEGTSSKVCLALSRSCANCGSANVEGSCATVACG